MIAYTTVGTNDLPRAVSFYDALLGELGAKRFMEGDTFVAWSTAPGTPGFGVSKPFNQQPATVGNGCMIALSVSDPTQLAAVHAKALELGATDEGAPGPRGGGGFVCGYFRDLDGNKINLFCPAAG